MGKDKADLNLITKVAYDELGIHNRFIWRQVNRNETNPQKIEENETWRYLTFCYVFFFFTSPHKLLVYPFSNAIKYLRV